MQLRRRTKCSRHTTKTRVCRGYLMTKQVTCTEAMMTNTTPKTANTNLAVISSSHETFFSPGMKVNGRRNRENLSRDQTAIFFNST